MRRQRNDVTVELRKAIRDEQMIKHRNIILNDHDDELEFNQNCEMTIDAIKEGKI